MVLGRHFTGGGMGSMRQRRHVSGRRVAGVMQMMHGRRYRGIGRHLMLLVSRRARSLYYRCEAL